MTQGDVVVVDVRRIVPRARSQAGHRYEAGMAYSAAALHRHEPGVARRGGRRHPQRRRRLRVRHLDARRAAPRSSTAAATRATATSRTRCSARARGSTIAADRSTCASASSAAARAEAPGAEEFVPSSVVGQRGCRRSARSRRSSARASRPSGPTPIEFDSGARPRHQRCRRPSAPSTSTPRIRWRRCSASGIAARHAADLGSLLVVVCRRLRRARLDGERQPASSRGGCAAPSTTR